LPKLHVYQAAARSSTSFLGLSRRPTELAISTSSLKQLAGLPRRQKHQVGCHHDPAEEAEPQTAAKPRLEGLEGGLRGVRVGHEAGER
jgi:hypothetical protein